MSNWKTKPQVLQAAPAGEASSKHQLHQKCTKSGHAPAGELFAECPLPNDGTSLTTVSAKYLGRYRFPMPLQSLPHAMAACH